MPQAEGFADLVLGTLKDLGRFKWSNLAFPLTKYVGFKQLLNENRLALNSGTSMQWNLQTSTNGAARHVPLNATDNVNISDSMAQATEPMRHSTTNWALDEREITMNMGEAQIFDIVKTSRAAGWGDLVKLVESTIWDCPATSASDSPRGLLYYIVKDTTSATGAFTTAPPVTAAQVATDFTTIAGIVPSTTNNWTNWAAAYTSITKTNLIANMRRAATNTDFESPIDVPEYAGAPNYGIYSNYAVVSAIEALLEQQNQNLGNDIASKDGVATFRRHPIVYVPTLDANTKNPVIGVNWSQMKFRYLKGEYFREMQDVAPMQHRTIRHFVDLSWGLQCYDRRGQFIIQTA